MASGGTIDKFYIETTFCSDKKELAACFRGSPEEPEGARRWFAHLGQFTREEENLPIDRSKHCAWVSDEALEVLAQTLWDLGFRPREALNHDEALKALRSERDFLRERLVECASDLRSSQESRNRAWFESLRPPSIDRGDGS